ncbi:MAG TPA: hypothetical protein VIE66_08945 [Methylocella sp.]
MKSLLGYIDLIGCGNKYGLWFALRALNFHKPQNRTFSEEFTVVNADNDRFPPSGQLSMPTTRDKLKLGTILGHPVLFPPVGQTA